jgi:hypothetical protein
MAPHVSRTHDGPHHRRHLLRPPGRKYELRVVVYRDGDHLRAYPSVVKVNRQTFDPEHPTRESLLNNITTSANETCSSGLNFILPLCSRDTLATLGISEQELQVGRGWLLLSAGWWWLMMMMVLLLLPRLL